MEQVKKSSWIYQRKQSEILKVNTKEFIFWETKKSIKSLIFEQGKEVFNLTLFSFENKNKKVGVVETELYYQIFIEPKKEMNFGDDGTFKTGKEGWKRKVFGRNYWKNTVWKGYKKRKIKL